MVDRDEDDGREEEEMLELPVPGRHGGSSRGGPTEVRSLEQRRRTQARPYSPSALSRRKRGSKDVAVPAR